MRNAGPALTGSSIAGEFRTLGSGWPSGRPAVRTVTCVSGRCAPFTPTTRNWNVSIHGLSGSGSVLSLMPSGGRLQFIIVTDARCSVMGTAFSPGSITRKAFSCGEQFSIFMPMACCQPARSLAAFRFATVTSSSMPLHCR